MELRFWGVRGSFPVSGKDKTRFGGHTPCAGISSSDGRLIIIDAGTGIRDLGKEIMRSAAGKPVELHLLLTHFHLDHIMGLPFFKPLRSPQVTITFYADEEPELIEGYLGGLMDGRYFPHVLGETEAVKIFKKIEGDSFSIGNIEISQCPLQHPQRSTAYRLGEAGKSIVFATDTEHPNRGHDQRLISFCRGADFLIYDATFTPQEYAAGCRGWGHSTWLEGIEVAKAAGVGTLCLSHFNPDHSDEALDEMAALAQHAFPSTLAAREGLKRSWQDQ
jgi:phosphoribosyl 1,2-cyclic phosphodiesterase